eukprot:CAMPEP_0183468406 /NCGR_PEP_ID=MMETSP0370-20130417/152684_1 /TAXON_ID=268820 /ORGANISM="Peridinium aciculiferum, Strain PAER-2" /LENGTH=303 /DNA_ID=CAMNT_0025660797 /DNA_START=25 /DNA_END=934 /DNA_ORIENTATION=-
MQSDLLSLTLSTAPWPQAAAHPHQDPTDPAATDERAREAVAVPVHKGASAVMLAVLPLAAVPAPISSWPLDVALPVSAILHELPKVSHATAPLHDALARNAVVSELAPVHRAVPPRQLALTIGSAAIELALVVRTIWPQHLYVATARARDVSAVDDGAVDPILRAGTVPLVLRPLPLVFRAIQERQAALPLPQMIRELALVQCIVGVNDPSVALLGRGVDYLAKSDLSRIITLSALLQPAELRDELGDVVPLSLRLEQERKGPGGRLQNHSSLRQLGAYEDLVVLLAEFGEVWTREASEEVGN